MRNNRTAWIIGTANLCITSVNLIAVFFSGKLVFGILAFLYAMLTPIFVIDPRKELTGAFACVLHCSISLCYTCIFIYLFGFNVLAANLAIWGLSIFIYRIPNRKSLLFFRDSWPSDIICLSNTTTILVGYYAFICLVFCIAVVFCNCIGLFIQITLLAITLLLSSFYLYYKNWYIQISKDSIILYRKQLHQRVSTKTLKVKKIFNMYLLFDYPNHAPVIIFQSMSGFSSIWPIIRDRL